ncbi:MAG: radical SAM protein, partial [Acidobacteria bacterium]|nr:radical SAM protein [Acidobacteriota bacterium]
MKSKNFCPSYLNLLKNGELEKKVLLLKENLLRCSICPRNCAVNRIKGGKGYCRTGKNAMVASYCVHRGEEPIISGANGSGTVFFAKCNLSCSFCQNYEISQEWKEGVGETSAEKLAEIYLELQANKVHNINWVSPSHVAPQAVEAVLIAAKKGLNIPVVYNSNGYDSVETLKILEGIVDIYMPDFKYFDDEAAKQLSDADDYQSFATKAIKEMWRQVGGLILNDDGVAIKGLLIRHLVLPRDLSQSEKVIKFISEEISAKAAISLMSQY